MPRFVLVACGDEHVRKANLAVRALKRFTRVDILGVAARSRTPVEHDEAIQFEPPPDLTNVQASRYMKTGLAEIIGSLQDVYCYLDNDVLCVSHEASRIFSLRRGAINFAPDHQSNLWQHARTAMKTPVPRGGGPQLQVALRERFHVDIDPHWNLWNGGVFLFDDASRDFLAMWQQFTCRLFNDPELHPRDQGALAATVWTLGLEHEPLLPVDYNWIMGCTLGYHYKLRYEDGRFCYQDHRPKFLHFICDRTDRWEYRKVLEMLGHEEAVVREVSSPCVH